jgi:two-component system C4-dicarboxylate transport response regulator DctD
MDGLELLRRCLALDRELPVVLVTGHGDVSMAVQAMREGAYDFIEKPFPSEQLIEVARRALEKRALVMQVRALRGQLRARGALEATVIGRSHAMERLRQRLAAIAASGADVLVYGETGTGKELAARALHRHGLRPEGPFVAINCAAIPEQLFESELFGHEPGAFSGALKRRVGKLEHASGGTLFLDEIESMPLGMQAKLLRALQERSIVRLGSNHEIGFDCRVVAASKEDLARLAGEQKFRADLYYRLGVAVLELPALRERREDIALLFEHFVLQAAERYARAAPLVSEALLQQLMARDWPGNVRELRNVADRFVLGILEPALDAAGVPAEARALAELVGEFERNLIRAALARHGSSLSAVSAALRVPRKTLYDKLRKYALLPPAGS